MRSSMSYLLTALFVFISGIPHKIAVRFQSDSLRKPSHFLRHACHRQPRGLVARVIALAREIVCGDMEYVTLRFLPAVQRRPPVPEG